jgi:hypothetical protein
MKNKTFNVQASISILCSTTISAKDLTEAAEKSKDLKVEDFIEILGEHIDSNMTIQGINDDGVWC